jgi:hypothetical protein
MVYMTKLLKKLLAKNRNITWVSEEIILLELLIFISQRQTIAKD